MSEINRKAKTLERWEEILLPNEVEALYGLHHTDPMEVLTPNEVLDIIVEWTGGVRHQRRHHHGRAERHAGFHLRIAAGTCFL